MFSLRSGVKVLQRADVIERLHRLNSDQLREVITRVQKFKPHMAKAWTHEEVRHLVAAWKKIK
jgi:hypothetical protein